MSAPLVNSWLVLPDGGMFELRKSCAVGRAPENDLVLDDDQISRRHAFVQAQGETEFWLVDLGSSNGTYVNGRRIAQPVELKKGDVITMGGSRLVFQSEALSAAHKEGDKLLTSTLLSVKQTGCWMIVADIIGSTHLARRLPPEELPRVTGGWFKSCRQIIDDCGGHITKYLGDGFFCHWEDGDGATANVIRAIEHLDAHQKKSSPAFRFVVHHGPVVIGSVPTMAELNLHGPQVNFAFRMEKLAGRWNEPLLYSEPASERIKLRTWMAHDSEVEGFEGRFRFFAPGLPKA